MAVMRFFDLAKEIFGEHFECEIFIETNKVKF